MSVIAHSATDAADFALFFTALIFSFASSDFAYSTALPAAFFAALPIPLAVPKSVLKPALAASEKSLLISGLSAEAEDEISVLLVLIVLLCLPQLSGSLLLFPHESGILLFCPPAFGHLIIITHIITLIMVRPVRRLADGSVLFV
ncbi:MAG TPA: hypothetical protein P5191_11665 [Ruminococcus sp.]|nr:hypothetical protein [Ruminococcus sp.]